MDKFVEMVERGMRECGLPVAGCAMDGARVRVLFKSTAAEAHGVHIDVSDVDPAMPYEAFKARLVDPAAMFMQDRVLGSESPGVKARAAEDRVLDLMARQKAGDASVTDADIKAAAGDVVSAMDAQWAGFTRN